MPALTVFTFTQKALQESFTENAIDDYFSMNKASIVQMVSTCAALANTLWNLFRKMIWLDRCNWWHQCCPSKDTRFLCGSAGA